MKKVILAFALFVSVAGVTTANTPANSSTATAVTSARELANALLLNEAQYVKVKTLEGVRIEEVKAAQASLTGDALTASLAVIQEKFNNALLLVLNPSQQKAFEALKSGQGVPAIAQGK
ncbi:hypothetical protein [Rufibacter quisquiliarum]|uniref:Uncharacterized protein n=1 Tax=Rufibacter quisquiliarum TaxID=1549639 RepID=A0A839GWG3_9BACT|nr:hypothetical protein [Rufibacter quisquiliarum]MBA9079207.1 hypothetical protein [Rufibacter quisquiliarum]